MTDEQLIERLQDALESEAERIEPQAALLASVHAELLRTARADSDRGVRLPSISGVLAVGMAVAVTVAVTVIALSLGAHQKRAFPIRTTDAVEATPPAGPKLPLGTPAGPATADPNLSQGAAIPTTVRLVAETSDPQGGLPWGLRAFQTTRGDTCLQVGRVQNGTIGVIGQDNAWQNDGRFHPIAPNAYTADSCSGTDANGHAFNNVAVRGAIASADVPWGSGRQSGECRIGPQPANDPVCPRADVRELAYGLLGPDAASITFVGNGGRLYTEPTNGAGGAYLIVLGRSTRRCTLILPGGQSCPSGGGQTSAAALSPGVITGVSYRDGHVCNLPDPTSSGAAQASCPPVGYVAPHSQPVTPAQVATPVTARALPATQYCIRASTQLSVPCDHGVPRGYTPMLASLRGRQLLIEISFTARVAVARDNSYYEWALSGLPGSTCSGGGASGTTLTNIRAGQRVIIQDFEAARCRGAFSGIVTFQTNGNGNQNLDPSGTIRDGSILVGRFSFTVS